MKNKNLLLGLALTLAAPILYSTPLQLNRGDLLDTDEVQIEIRQLLDCSPGHCSVSHTKVTISAVNLEKYSQLKKLNTDTLDLLNISVNNSPVPSCQNLQTQAAGYSTVLVNQSSCLLG